MKHGRSTPRLNAVLILRKYLLNSFTFYFTPPIPIFYLESHALVAIAVFTKHFIPFPRGLIAEAAIGCVMQCT